VTLEEEYDLLMLYSYKVYKMKYILD
jgi:hypothetical protein